MWKRFYHSFYLIQKLIQNKKTIYYFTRSKAEISKYSTYLSTKLIDKRKWDWCTAIFVVYSDNVNSEFWFLDWMEPAKRQFFIGFFSSKIINKNIKF